MFIGDGLLGLHGFDVLEGEMIGLEDEAAEDVFRELDVAFNAGDLGAFALEEGEDVDAALLAFDFVGEAAFVPLADVEDFRVGAVEDVLHFVFGGFPRAGGVGGVEEEECFVLTCVGGHGGTPRSASAASDATGVTMGFTASRRGKDRKVYRKEGEVGRGLRGEFCGGIWEEERGFLGKLLRIYEGRLEFLEELRRGLGKCLFIARFVNFEILMTHRVVGMGVRIKGRSGVAIIM